MAIYHLRASVISRSQGRSATAAAAYRAGERIEDRRTGLVFDYAAKGGVTHREIVAPEGAPAWVQDRAELWNQAEEAERRKNSQVAREVRVALPGELTHAQRVELVRGFVRAQFAARGMVADVALHAPGAAGDERNHHAHILLTTRELGEAGPDGAVEGFGAKQREWNKVELLGAWREAWAREANAALERAGREERVDHRTLVAQREEALERAAEARERGDEPEELAQTVRAVELDRPPLPQLSPGAWQMKARGIEVGRVAAWHEAKARAAEVREIAAGLARDVRAWLAERAATVAERVRERLGPSQGELALAGGRGEPQGPLDRSAPETVRPDRQGDLAARLRAAWEARQARTAAPEAEASRGGETGREAPQDLAARLRTAAAGMDPERMGAFADRVAGMREDRLADEREARMEAAREQEVARERTRERQRERGFERERGRDFER